MENLRIGAHGLRSPIESHRSPVAPALWAVISLLSLALSGCVTPPPAVSPPSPTPPPPPEAKAPAPTCPTCEDQNREIARLRLELANRDEQLRDQRSSQRDQVKVLQESTREVTRAKVKLRRLATQADAASYIAEVEVAMESLRGSMGAPSNIPLIVLAQGILESTSAPFVQGDYGMAMDRAAQAEQLITLVAHYQVGPAARVRAPGEVPLQIAIPLKVTADSNLRRQPFAKAPLVAVLKKDSPLVARAYKGSWLQVETEDGRAGWVDQARLGAR
jgi:SH3 domain-containing protein